MPKVSICIPAYNQVTFLKLGLESILSQTYHDYEVIITDDSDNDNVKNLIDKYNFDGRLQYYRNNQALGAPKNWNYCLSKAQGEYIKIIHHDDWFSTNSSLEKLVKLLESNRDNSFAFCGCNNLSVDGENLFIHSITDEHALIIKKYPEFLFYSNQIGGPSVTIFKNNKLAFDENIKFLVDIEFYIQLLKFNNNFSHTTETLMNIGHSAEQVTNLFTNNKRLLISEYSYTLKKLNPTKKHFYWYFKTFWNLFESFNISSIADLNVSGWQGEAPRFILNMVKARQFFKNLNLYKHQRTVQAIVYNYCKQLV